MRMIIAKEQDERIVDIFQSNPDILFTFFPVFKYQLLYILAVSELRAKALIGWTPEKEISKNKSN